MRSNYLLDLPDQHENFVLEKIKKGKMSIIQMC